MGTEKQKKSAEVVYNTIIRYLDGKGFKYTIREAPADDYMIQMDMKGDDLPISLYIIVDADRELIMVKSPELTKFGADQIDMAAKAVCVVNNAIVDGSYALDIDDGRIMWTVTSCYRGSLVGEETIHYLLGVSVATLDHHNDLFMMMKMGVLDLDGFREKVK